jgi:tetratricopeptide (TPR) repeat protein
MCKFAKRLWLKFSKIILARIYYETGRYEKALEWLQHLALRLEDVEAGYGLVLLVQARVIKGIYLYISLKSVHIIDNRICKPSPPLLTSQVYVLKIKKIIQML